MGLGFGWFWYAPCFLFNIKFAHICSLTALERYLPKKIQNPSQSSQSSQSDHHKTTNHGASNAFLSEPVNISLTSLSIACILLLAMPLFLTILTKHQALAPSGPILFCFKSRFFSVEFSLRPSAKAWQEKSGP